jgi:serine protease Do
MHSRLSVRKRRIAFASLVLFIALASGAGSVRFLPPVSTASAETPTATTAAPNATASTDELADLQARFQAISDKVAPAVVAISASTQADLSPSACRTEEMSGDRLQAFLSKTTRMVGTGFIIDADGYILTNDHVIDDAEQLWITTDDRRVYPAIVIGSDPRSDLAVLKIPGHHLPTVHFGDGAAVHRGAWSIAVGNPYGLSGEGGMCVSVGVVSAVHRSLPRLSDSENRLYSNLIQTTAQINPGNSGGPLFDLHGDVIGINTAVIMPQKTVNGIGFALPVDDHLRSIVSRLKNGNEIVYGYLGVIVVNPSDRDRESAGITRPIGARVDTVEAQSPAEGKIDLNDLVISVEGHTVTDSTTFIRLVGSAPLSRPVSISVIRGGKALTVLTTLRKRPMPVAAVTTATQRLRWGGMLLGPLSIDTDGKCDGLVVLNIDPASPFMKQGLHEGSIITTVAGRSISELAQLQGIINDTPFERCAIGVAPETATASINTGEDR